MHIHTHTHTDTHNNIHYHRKVKRSQITSRRWWWWRWRRMRPWGHRNKDMKRKLVPAMGQQWLCGSGGGFQGTMGWRRTLRILLWGFCCWFAVGASSGAHVAYTKSKSHILCSSWCGMMCMCKCVEQLTSAGSGYISRLPGTFCIGEGAGSQVKPVRCSLRKMQPLKEEKPNQTKTSTTTNGI